MAYNSFISFCCKYNSVDALRSQVLLATDQSNMINERSLIGNRLRVVFILQSNPSYVEPTGVGCFKKILNQFTNAGG